METETQAQLPRGKIIPEYVFGFVILWFLVFILIFLAICRENYLLSQNTEVFSEIIETGITWVKRPNYEPRQGAAYLEEDLLKKGEKYFVDTPQIYSALVRAAAADMRDGRFGDKQLEILVGDLRTVYKDFTVKRSEILRKQGFYYFILLIIIVASYQAFVIISYLFLNTTPGVNGNEEKDYLLFVEGFYNAIDLCILAAVTSIFFDKDNLWVSAFIFFGYLLHMVYFGLFLLTIEDRRKSTVAAAYLLSILMPIVMAAVAIENRDYFFIALMMLLLCGIFGIVAVLFIKIIGGAPRLAPYTALTAQRN
jgi:hypothetical protein